MKNKPKLTEPRWQTAQVCNHDFVKLTSKNGRPFTNGMSQYRCKLCGYKKVARG